MLESVKPFLSNCANQGTFNDIGDVFQGDISKKSPGHLKYHWWLPGAWILIDKVNLPGEVDKNHISLVKSTVSERMSTGHPDTRWALGDVRVIHFSQLWEYLEFFRIYSRERFPRTSSRGITKTFFYSKKLNEFKN